MGNTGNTCFYALIQTPVAICLSASLLFGFFRRGWRTARSGKYEGTAGFKVQ